MFWTDLVSFVVLLPWHLLIINWEGVADDDVAHIASGVTMLVYVRRIVDRSVALLLWLCRTHLYLLLVTTCNVI